MTGPKAQKNIEGLISAERSFAAFSVDHGTREAFLTYMDSNAIVFDKGEAVSARKLWSIKPNSSGILNWYPQWAGIASSGDFGYTTGPWTFQPGIHDSVTRRGQYTTVWHIGPEGHWKFLVDLGTGYSMENPARGLVRLEPGESAAGVDTVGMLKAEQEFINTYQKRPDIPYKKFLSDESILNHNGSLPAISADAKELLISSMPVHLQFSMGGSGMAVTGDLGFVYGTIILEGKKENYLHIWRKEKEGWKLALEVLRI